MTKDKKEQLQGCISEVYFGYKQVRRHVISNISKEEDIQLNKEE